MLRSIAGAAGLVLLFVGASNAIQLSSPSETSDASCKSDDEVDPADRQAIGASALAFVRTVLGPHPDDAFDLMTPAAQAITGRKKMIADTDASIKPMAPFSDPVVNHVYRIESRGSGSETDEKLSCIGSDKQPVVAAYAPGTVQAHALLSARTLNYSWAFSLWMFPSNEGWKVRHFQFALGGLAAYAPLDLLAKARSERDAGHTLNAALLLAATHFASNRGEALVLDVDQQAIAEMKRLAPTEISGGPPFTFTLQGQPYKVGHITILADGGKLGLSFDLPHDTSLSNADAETANRAFLTGFIATHPEYSQDFEFLSARALKSDNSGSYNTVYENGKGFLPEPESGR